MVLAAQVRRIRFRPSVLVLPASRLPKTAPLIGSSHRTSAFPMTRAGRPRDPQTWQSTPAFLHHLLLFGPFRPYPFNSGLASTPKFRLTSKELMEATSVRYSMLSGVLIRL